MSRGLVKAVALLSAALAPVLGAAAAPPDAYLAQLAGRWELAGTVRGKAVHYRGEARWVLEHGWLCFSLSDPAPPGYVANVYLGFDAKQGDYVAHWLDKFGAPGARVVATGTRDGETLVLLFPYADGAFRDTLTLAADGASGSWLLESQEHDGSWSTFASFTLARPRAAAAGGKPR